MDANEPSGSVNKGDHASDATNGCTISIANVHVDCVVAVRWSGDGSGVPASVLDVCYITKFQRSFCAC